MRNETVVTVFFYAVLTAAVLLLASFFVPWEKINWGRFALQPAATVTVTGEAESQERSQLATFSAGVTAVNDNRETAVAEVNQKVEAIIASVKDFGIPAEDVKTQNLNVYQSQESIYTDGRQKLTPGQWSVNNTIEIKLRDVDRASGLADLLTSSGATNIYGPNFTLDDTKDIEIELLDEAIADARTKAEKMATAGGKKLGELVNVVEGGSQTPIQFFAREAGGGGGAPIEPGTGGVTVSVTATFELE